MIETSTGETERLAVQGDALKRLAESGAKAPQSKNQYFLVGNTLAATV